MQRSSAHHPPSGKDIRPRDVAAWWHALSEEERVNLIAEHPDRVSNLDGVPVADRHAANIGSLEREIAAAQAAMDALPTFEEFRAQRPDMVPSQARAAHDTMLLSPRTRLNEARSIRSTLLKDQTKPESGYDPDKFLMTFKPGAHELMAAIAVGNPDKADHVTVTTPGMNTHASSMPALVDQASALKAEMENQLELAGQPDADVSTIAWFGYDPPDTRDRTVLGALSEDRANAGAVDLANLYRGINATNERGSDVHLSAFGHSYGSMTTAQALNELGETGVVDDAAFYGSPGLGYANERVMGAFGKFITDEPDLFLEQGHGYVMSAHNDPVSEEYIWNGISLPALADAGAHGPNPNTLPLEQLGTDAAVTPDGVSRSGAVGHSQYPRTAEIQTPTGKRDVLRTTGYNLAIIGAGLAHGARELLVR